MLCHVGEKADLQAEQAHDEERDGVGALAVHGGRLQVAVQVQVRLDAQLLLPGPQLPQPLCITRYKILIVKWTLQQDMSSY